MILLCFSRETLGPICPANDELEATGVAARFANKVV